ncbi:HdeD family acid-resistance protein [Bacteroides sp. 51]|uniref:HdeD family acid-resistance protein n=1 Tax=Bacteroides sp. 51 TaxID=2302938 RepID=UPI0013D1F9EE|nr:DUF308 domain-containing protein [Bacteroides sp. 51]NDV83587.1 DUF308 domain-containing protein [Bacteroides sp. 51]
MKHLNYSLIRIVFALIIGLVLVIWPDTASDYLVITIGILFIIPGLIGLIGYFTSNKTEGQRFPLEGLGSLLFGIWLVLMPDFFANLLMYLLGIILVLGGAQQIYSVYIARRWTTVPLGFYALPVLTLLGGLFILFNPVEARNTAFLIIGIMSIVYAVTELINWFRFTNRKPKTPMRTDIEEATIIEE